MYTSNCYFSGCGILGVYAFNRNCPSLHKFKEALSLLSHRGPDGSGTWCNQNILMGHTRLSIIDLSEHSSQPMETDKSVISYNGEVYNYSELAKTLQLSKLNSSSDTEVLQKLIDRKGFLALNSINGIFAFAYYNKHTHVLTLARDPIGIKPLYYYLDSTKLIFSSEVLPIMILLGKAMEINTKLLKLQILYTSALTLQEDTIINGIKSIIPGTYMNFYPEFSIENCKYFNFKYSSHSWQDENQGKINHIEKLLINSTKLQSNSHVSIGGLISGGLDSSLLAVLMLMNTEKYRLYTLDYIYHGKSLENEDKDYVVKICREKDWDIYFSKYQLNSITIEHIQNIIEIQSLSDDFRFIIMDNNYRNAKIQGCKVIINGQGADEIFGGYLNKKLANILISKQDIVNLFDYLLRSRFVSCLANSAEEEIIHYNYIHKLAITYNEKTKYLSYVKFMLETQLRRILTFEDFLSMKNSIECRVPYLDHRIVQACINIPISLVYKFSEHTEKHILRQIAAKYLPRYIFKRKKKAYPSVRQDLLNQIYDKLRYEADDIIKDSVLINEMLDFSRISKNWHYLHPRLKWNIIALAIYENKYSKYLII